MQSVLSRHGGTISTQPPAPSFEKKRMNRASLQCTMSEALLVSHAVEAPNNALPIWRRSAFAAEFGDAFISDTDLEGGTCADGVWSPLPAVTFSAISPLMMCCSAGKFPGNGSASPVK
jgi:hypothetical protein